MSQTLIYDPEELRLLILNCNEPLLFKDVIISEIQKWSLPEWACKLKKTELEFRIGKFAYTKEPQWESTTKELRASFDYFLQFIKSEQCNWLYFDYKHLNEWFANCEELRKSINWAPLGFPNITANDCTIWIGTKGAHTPCHVDTYGFNLIWQVYGRKLWILAPPEENLKPSRIPYEESSIYSKLNFFSPDLEDFKGIGNCRKIVLNPGDVLYLPHKWWHYVENLETAISINVWIPLPQDDEERLNESIVQFFVKQTVDASDEKISNIILNPNMRQNIFDGNISDIMEIINRCKNICQNKHKNKKMKCAEHCSTREINESELLEKYSYIEKISIVTNEDFAAFLEQQKKRFKNTPDDAVSENNDALDLLNAVTNGDVISLISKKLLGR